LYTINPGCEIEICANAISIYRRNTDLPIVFTVRSQSQGGSYCGSEESLFHLLELGIRAGCEFIDMEVCWSYAACSRLLKVDAITYTT